MAQQTYDPDSDQRHSPKAISAAEDAAVSSNPVPSDARGLAGPEVAGRENRAADKLSGRSDETDSSTNTQSNPKDAPDDTVGEKGYTGGETKKKGILGKIQGLSRARKWFLVGAATGGGGLLGMILLLFILASSLKIPDLAQNITAYQFARLSRQYSQSANRVTAEKLAADGLNEDTWKTALRDRYQGLRDSTWGKFDKYRPAQVIKNLEGENGFRLNYSEPSKILGRQQLVGVTLNNETHLVVQNTAKTRFVPGLSSVIDYKNNISLSRRLQPALDAALRDKDIGPIIRGGVAKKIRQELGITLVAWSIGKFQGKDAKAARLEEARQKYNKVDEKTPPNDAVNKSTQSAVADAENEAKAIIADDAKLQTAIDEGGVPSSIRDIISKAVQQTTAQDIASVANSTYAVAVPACIIYDGSLENSGPTIDNQVRQQASQYQYVASGADQQKTGSQDTNSQNATGLATAISATNDDLGDITTTNAIKRGYGQTVDTSASLSPEASAGGEFSLLNAIPGVPSAFADTLNTFADNLCPTLTDIRFAIGTAVLTWAAKIITGGSSAAVEETAKEGATIVVDKVASNIAERVLAKTVSGGIKTKAFLGDVTKSTVKVVGLTIIAKLIVNSRAGQLNGGLTQGQSLADGADSGGGLMSGMIEQKQMYGRPMLQGEVAQSDQTDQKTVEAMNSSKSTYQRYFATDNAFSLVSRMAMSVSGNANNSIFRSVINIASMLFRPMTYFGSFMTSLNGRAHAAVSDTHYGNVQFGWSQEEEALIDSNQSYSSSLENQQALDDSGKEDEIGQKYDKCFSSSIGELLSSGDIQRDSDGNVLSDAGDCAPNNLGPNNSKYGDLVFRWRLAHSYSNTLDQLTGVQNAAAQ